MSRRSLFCLVICALLAGRCTIDSSAGGASETGNAMAFVRVEAYDAPASFLDAVLLSLRSVELHSDELGWQTIADKDTVIDFLSLVGGTTALLGDAEAPAGWYTEMRLWLADSCSVVMGDSVLPLVVPSGTESGIKITLGMTLEEGDTTTLFLDFDAARSVKYNDTGYRLMPVFHVVASDEAGRVSGEVLSGAGAVDGAVVDAWAGGDTLSTLTGPDGRYQLILAEGTYTVSCSHPDLGSAQPEGWEVVVEPGSTAADRDFSF